LCSKRTDYQTKQVSLEISPEGENTAKQGHRGTNRLTKERLDRRFPERKRDRRFQVQLEEDESAARDIAE